MKKPILRIEYDDAIKLLMKDQGFSKYIQRAETGVNEFFQQWNFDLSCLFKVEKDCQYPDWEKIVLAVQFPVDIVDFKEEVKLWDQITDIIHKKIDGLEGVSSEKIEAFNKNFFILIWHTVLLPVLPSDLDDD